MPVLHGCVFNPSKWYFTCFVYLRTIFHTQPWMERLWIWFWHVSVCFSSLLAGSVIVLCSLSVRCFLLVFSNQPIHEGGQSSHLRTKVGRNGLAVHAFQSCQTSAILCHPLANAWNWRCWFFFQEFFFEVGESVFKIGDCIEEAFEAIVYNDFNSSSILLVWSFGCRPYVPLAFKMLKSHLIRSIDFMSKCII